MASRARRAVPALLALFALAGATSVVGQADHSNRLYGRVTTEDGDVYEGFIRWDKNEASWSDILSASKEMPERFARDAEEYGREGGRERTRSFEIFGLRIEYDADRDRFPSSATSGIRFGHISTLEVLGGDRAIAILKSGDEVEFAGGGDLGGSVRGVEVEDPRRGSVELDWDEIRTVDFMSGRWDAEPRSGARLYGTLVTRRGERFTGYVAWDVDEVFGSDILDGEERGRDREIPFRNIAAIERYGSSGARVYLKTGEDLVLRDSNDVDDSNRGIVVSVPAFGEVRVDWDAFERLDFEPSPPDLSFDRFDGGRRLRGTVFTRAGEAIEGEIRWDNDEEYSWEILDGELDRDVEMDIEFSAIATIERVSYRSARVVLHDGRAFELSGSNDVDEDNKGVFVRDDDGRVRVVYWDELDRVEFRL